MLVKISRHRARHLRAVALLATFPVACSLVIGELPEPLSDVGSMAGGADGDSGSSGLGGAGAAAGSEDSGLAGAAAGGDAAGGGTDGPPVAGGAPNSGQGGEPSGQSGAGGGADVCDADRDMHRASGVCGGDDCDDGDPQVSPAQTNYFASRQPNVDFDYNCGGGPEQEQMAAVVCSGLIGACPTSVSGFLGKLPACGEEGAWGTCVQSPPLNTCDQMVIDAQRRMRCH